MFPHIGNPANPYQTPMNPGPYNFGPPYAPPYNHADPGYASSSNAYPAPEPAQFANAGPPGYAYAPSNMGWAHDYAAQPQPRGSEYAAGSSSNAGFNAAPGSSNAEPQWRTRSEWSSPMQGKRTFMS